MSTTSTRTPFRNKPRTVGVGWLLLGAAATLAAGVYAAASEPPLPTVPHLDLSRYTGRWYEIARYPNRFEKQGDRDTTAEYALRPDGKISVVNTCIRADGSNNQAHGWAKIADTSSNAKLKVTFFWPFFGDYWVLELGANYGYAVVGEPGRKFLWILSRTPQMDDATYAAITSRLAARGYDASRLLRVRQTAR